MKFQRTKESIDDLSFQERSMYTGLEIKDLWRRLNGLVETNYFQI